jgi:hypothetical protein
MTMKPLLMPTIQGAHGTSTYKGMDVDPTTTRTHRGSGWMRLGTRRPTVSIHSQPMLPRRTNLHSTTLAGQPTQQRQGTSTVLAAIIDEDNSICQNALTHGVRMFGAQVKFLRCGDNPTLLQCSRCHLLGHYAKFVQMQDLPKECYQMLQMRRKS